MEKKRRISVLRGVFCCPFPVALRVHKAHILVKTNHPPLKRFWEAKDGNLVGCPKSLTPKDDNLLSRDPELTAGGENFGATKWETL